MSLTNEEAEKLARALNHTEPIAYSPHKTIQEALRKQKEAEKRLAQNPHREYDDG